MPEASEAMKAMARRIAEHQVPDQSFSTHSLTLAMRSIAEAAALAAIIETQRADAELADAFIDGSDDAAGASIRDAIRTGNHYAKDENNG